MRTEVMQNTFFRKILLFLTIEVLCHVQSAEIYSDFNIGRGFG